MRTRIPLILFFALASGLNPAGVNAGSSQSAGLSLTSSAGGAASSALGEAYSPAIDDIGAIKYNPASVATLKSAQASFQYHRGALEDSHGQLLVGAPIRNGAVGVSLNYYDGGDLITLRDGQEHTIKAQKDMALGLSYGRKERSLLWGVSGKYLSSEVATFKASALATDVGLTYLLSGRIRIAGALQNIGTSLKYRNKNEPLPRLLRAGSTFLLIPGRNTTVLFIELPYYLNERDLRKAIGLETRVRPLAVRAGYLNGKQIDRLSMGLGITVGRHSIDYAIGMVDKLDARHLISFTMKFGAQPQASGLVTHAPRPIVEKNKPVSPTTPSTSPSETKEAEKPADEPIMTPLPEVPTISIPVQQSIPTNVEAPPPVEPVTKEETLPRETISKPAEEKVKERTVRPAPKRNVPGKKEKKTAQIKGPKRNVYTVEPGDTFESIALKIYGDKKEWKRIYEANKENLKGADSLIGKKLYLP